MSQEKQKTVRILQSKNSSSKKPRFYLLIGFLSGVLTTVLCVFLYAYTALGGLIPTTVSKDPALEYSSQAVTDEDPTIVNQDNRTNTIKDEDLQVSHISDKELRKIFKPQATTKEKQQLTIDLNTAHAKDLTPFIKIEDKTVSTQQKQASRSKTEAQTKQSSQQSTKDAPNSPKVKDSQTSSRQATNNSAKMAHVIVQKRRTYTASTVISV